MSLPRSADPPLQTPLVEPPEDGRSPSWLITRVWNDYFRTLSTRSQTSASVLKSIPLSSQSASIAPTVFAIGAGASGVYRVMWTARVTTAASTSSSLIVTIGYTDTVACTQSGAAMTGNTPATVQSGVILLRTDASASVTYSTTYASVGATAMVYKLDLILEAVS